jgi:acetolactate decarboxylase
MKNMNFKITLLGLTILTLTSCSSKAQQTTNEVKIVGEMKNVMWKGQLYGNINLNTIFNKTNLYGIGPVEYLTGEILIIDGKSYKSTVVSDTTMKVEETYDLKAPFFGYTNIAKWTEQTLPDSIQTIQQLEQYVDKVTKSSQRPFMFKLSGTVEQATIHIVNLPKGSKVSSPDEAHKGQKNYELKNEQSEIIGFFSTEHKAIFTHHDTYLHMHLITADRKKMGHLDEVLFKKGTIKLYLPTE